MSSISGTSNIIPVPIFPWRISLVLFFPMSSDSNINTSHLHFVVFLAPETQLGQNKTLHFSFRILSLFSPIPNKSMTIYENILYSYLPSIPTLKSWANLEGFISKISKICQNLLTPLCPHYAVTVLSSLLEKSPNYTSCSQFSSFLIIPHLAESVVRKHLIPT